MSARDGRLRHQCTFPRWLTGDAEPIERGDEWPCPRCGQVWVALVHRPHNNPRNGDWRKLRAGTFRRPVRRLAALREDLMPETPEEADSTTVCIRVPADWRPQLQEVASLGHAESVARLVEGWGDS